MHCTSFARLYRRIPALKANSDPHDEQVCLDCPGGQRQVQCCQIALMARITLSGLPLPSQWTSGSQGRNLELIQGAGDNSPTLRERHRGIFNVHRLMLADGTPWDGILRDVTPCVICASCNASRVCWDRKWNPGGNGSRSRPTLCRCILLPMTFCGFFYLR